jgi:glycosyltransferase involved in cell wall biosynthesis
MKILFLAAYSELAASSRTRVYDYFPFLEKGGIEYKCLCFTPSFLHKLTSQHRGLFSKIAYFTAVFLIKIINIFKAIILAPSYDIIFIQKIIFPFGLEKFLKLLNKNIIFEFDDAIFTDEDEKKSFLNKIKANFKKNGFANMLKVAKVCLVENDYNRDIALKYCPWIEIITGPIDTERYFLKEKKDKEKQFIIGWIGSSSTQKYLFLVEEALRELSKKYNIILRLSGVQKDFNMSGVNYQIEKWDIATEVAFAQSFNIGIVPLPDNAWTRGKGNYKLLQYMASGIPAVASPVETSKDMIKDGVNGFLANSHKEWVDKISLLIENENLRKKMGIEARKTMEDRYSLKMAAEKLVEIFENILNNKSNK